ncbi:MULTISPECIES: pentapeptide repeat-containing protein [Campylobacter]|uniref:pentapeptide repeat-containing protein n=1 Tax=Campylobacter TaxID=194 RepID=UPI0013EF5106|nr:MULTISPECIES: pentapeptide repeat-containing protein [Campylobacter]MDK2100892.1 pentapeptide repeat-containing protein [Campylobacter jejuni]MDK2134295.1 pentapeptide repeat-containing protein [Campylobacter jejuni]MDV6097909.1 pentapeptide repeat-containing protein [Campylobacter jejuni]MDV6102843.1 pentapeptide repeat-containing protein [Campylobacter jejuni]MDV6132264.1 pentapeptide repeat-containing protein [Campylobacter jejuni]
MERNIHNIELEIPNSGIFIMGLENENLIISLDLAKFECKKKLNAGELAKPLHPYIIYEVLEKNNKNNFNDVKIIDKIEDENNIIYYFNFRLILKENEDNKNKEALKTLSFMQNFIPAYFFSYQIIGDSKAIPKNVLEYLKNRYGYEGKNYKSIFKKEVYINCNCFERLNFSHCEFESKVSLRFLKDNKYKEFHNGVDFSNCIFKNEVDFSYFASGTPLPDNKYYNNAQNTLFKDCIFENKVDFHNSKITNNIYFNNAHFKDYVDFHECEFEKTASFYGVRFEKVPNFSACYFKEPKAVNLTNVNIDKLDFKSLEQYIEDNYKDESYKNETKGIQDEKEIFKIQNEHQLRYAKNLKDSFRVIKDVLITQNNKLEVQEWHKLELYAKEKELEIQLSKNKNDNLKKESKNQVYNPKDYEKFNYSKIIPLIIFLLKIIGHLSVNILIFVELVLVAPFFTIMFYCVYVVFFIYKILTFILKPFYPLDINKFIIFWRIKFNKIKRKLIVSGRKMLDFTLWSDCVLLQVYRNTSNHHTNFLKILNFTILMISLYAFMGFVFSKTINFILSLNSVSIIIASYIILLVFALMLVNVKKQLYQYAVILIFMLCGAFTISMILFLSSEYISIFCFLIYFLGVLIFYLFFICKIKLFIFLVRFFAYMIFIATIITKPQFINPFTGVFSSDKLYESQFEKSLNDLNASAIVNLASILQNDFNLHLKDQNISFTELNSAKALIIANKEKLKEILSKVYNDKYVSDYKKVLNELENNTSNVKNIIEEIDNKNNNSVVSAQLNKFLKLNFSQEIDILYAIKSNFSISEKLSPEQMALFDQKDSQDKLKSVLALLKFKSSFEGILKIINQDEITENTIKSTSVLYGIILLLCIFSLQKTARKNSIVPS